VIAHIGGVPVEETLLPVISGMSTALVLARAWVASRLRRGFHDEEDAPVPIRS
jgi:hypothetical protein